MKHDKIIYILIAIFLAYFAYIYSYTIDLKLDLNGDNAHYIQLARNIANGHGYASVNYDGIEKPANHFPPGYSAILSIFMLLGVNSLVGLKIINGVFLALTLIIIAYLVSKMTKQKYLAFSIIVLTIMSPQLMHFAGIVMSEMSYLLTTTLSILSLYFYHNQKEKNEDIKFYTSPWFYTAIIFAAGAYYIRTVGASIMFALIVFYLFRKEWLAALASVGGLFIAILPWSIRNAAAGLESRYLGTIMTVNPWRPEDGNIETMGEMIEKMIINIDQTVIKGFRELLFTFTEPNYVAFTSGVNSNMSYMGPNFQESSSLIAILISILIIGVMIFGAWKMKSLRWLLIAFFTANIGLFALWHGGNGSRYVVPIAPYIYVLFYTGIYYIVKYIAKDKLKANTPLMLIPLLMLFTTYGPIKVQHDLANQEYHPSYTNYFTLADKMEKVAIHNYVVCSRKPELFKIYAPSLHCTRYLFDEDPDAVIADLVKKKTDFVILDQLGYSSTPLYLYPAIQKHKDLFQIAVQLPNPDTYLFIFDKVKAKQKLGLKNK